MRIILALTIRTFDIKPAKDEIYRVLKLTVMNLKGGLTNRISLRIIPLFMFNMPLDRNGVDMLIGIWCLQACGHVSLAILI